MGFFHWPEIIVLLLLAVVFFGPKRLPEIGGALGQSIKEFRKSTTDLQDRVTGHDEETRPPEAAPRIPAADREHDVR